MVYFAFSSVFDWSLGLLQSNLGVLSVYVISLFHCDEFIG